MKLECKVYAARRGIIATKQMDRSNRAINSELITSLRKFIRPQARNVHDAEDILQNVLVKIMKSGNSISAASFLPWLRTICRTTSIDFYRKNKSCSVEIDNEKESSQVDEENTSALLLAKCVRPLLEKLKSTDFKILKAVELDGVSQNELAQKLDMNYSALKSKVQRARQKLKEEILECCAVELDKRNTPIEVKSKKKNECC